MELENYINKQSSEPTTQNHQDQKFGDWGYFCYKICCLTLRNSPAFSYFPFIQAKAYGIDLISSFCITWTTYHTSYLLFAFSFKIYKLTNA